VIPASPPEIKLAKCPNVQRLIRIYSAIPSLPEIKWAASGPD